MDLVSLAWHADITRVFSMIFARELSSRTYPNIGITDGHHAVSHHRNDPDLSSKKARIDAYHVQLLTCFLEKLDATRDGDGSLLDNSLGMYGGGMGGAFKTGRHLKYPLDTPMSNLLLTIFDKSGVRLDKIGDSTGRLEPDYLSLL
jgi:hypothetical protein